MRPDKLAVVIPCRAPSAALTACLGSLTQQWPARVAAEIVVVDDGSNLDYTLCTDGWSPSVRVERLLSPSGAGQARNYGVKTTTNEWIVFLDEDCTVPWGWTASILDFIEQNPKVSIAGGQIKSKYPRNWLSQATEDYILRSKLTKGGEPRVVTACAVVNRKAYDDVGGFHPRFTAAGGEDWDLSKRLYDAGHIVEINSNFSIYHANPRRPQSFLNRAWRYGKTSVLLTEAPPHSATPTGGLRRRLRPRKVFGVIRYGLRETPLVPNTSFIRAHRSRLLYVVFLFTYHAARWRNRQFNG